jgi:hypothetical protein
VERAEFQRWKGLAEFLQGIANKMVSKILASLLDALLVATLLHPIPMLMWLGSMNNYRFACLVGVVLLWLVLSGSQPADN